MKGLTNILHGGGGMYMDRFVTAGVPGLLLLHGYGNVFERSLAAGESILVEPGAFLYKDSSVTMDVEQQKLKTGLFGRQGLYLARMTGPGPGRHPVHVRPPPHRLSETNMADTESPLVPTPASGAAP